MIAKLSVIGLSVLAMALFGWLTTQAFGWLVASNGIGSIIGFGILFLVLLAVDFYVFVFGIIVSLLAIID